jgi:hypothetical protein
MLHRSFVTSVRPQVNAPAAKIPELKQKYEKKIQTLLTGEEHRWLKGLTPEEAEQLRKT